ncbi:MAG: HIT domain-containing protein [Alphaproteobacteria bacterium]|nr:HIT domain-containing protein [Alphaproteobacteria bacterium]
MTHGFTLDARLAADTEPVADFVLCRVRLMNDARFPWLILVPARPGLSEWHDVGPDDAALLWDETARAARALETLCAPEKINIAALGNIVRQLHIHVVARNTGDAAWPGPVWGAGTTEPYTPDALTSRREALAALLAGG